MKIINKNFLRESGRNPHVDWAMIFTVFLIITVFLIVDGIQLYSRVVSGKIQSPEVVTSTSAKTFNQKEFDTVLQSYQAKADAYSKVQKGYTKYVDPSHP